VLLYYRRLDSLYKAESKVMDTLRIAAKKDSIIRSFIENTKYLPVVNAKILAMVSKEALQSGNAFFISYKQYDSRQEEIEKIFNEKCDGDLRKLVTRMLRQKQ
jgi:hypothetical protein